MSAEAARAKAEKIHRDAREGIDPLQKREIVRAEPTVADLANEIEKHALVYKKQKSAYEDERMLKKIILPKLGKMRVSAVEMDKCQGTARVTKEDALSSESDAGADQHDV